MTTPTKIRDFHDDELRMIDAALEGLELANSATDQHHADQCGTYGGFHDAITNIVRRCYGDSMGQWIWNRFNLGEHNADDVARLCEEQLREWAERCAEQDLHGFVLKQLDEAEQVRADWDLDIEQVIIRLREIDEKISAARADFETRFPVLGVAS